MFDEAGGKRRASEGPKELQGERRKSCTEGGNSDCGVERPGDEIEVVKRSERDENDDVRRRGGLQGGDRAGGCWIWTRWVVSSGKARL